MNKKELLAENRMLQEAIQNIADAWLMRDRYKDESGHFTISLQYAAVITKEVMEVVK